MGYGEINLIRNAMSCSTREISTGETAPIHLITMGCWQVKRCAAGKGGNRI